MAEGVEEGAAITCDHLYSSIHDPSLPLQWVRQCMVCGGFDGDSMREEIEKFIALKEPAVPDIGWAAWVEANKIYIDAWDDYAVPVRLLVARTPKVLDEAELTTLILGKTATQAAKDILKYMEA